MRSKTGTSTLLLGTLIVLSGVLFYFYQQQQQQQQKQKTVEGFCKPEICEMAYFDPSLTNKFKRVWCSNVSSDCPASFVFNGFLYTMDPTTKIYKITVAPK